jgi:hypothetical protein
MGHLDLDAARAEYENQGHTIDLAGRTWHLPAKLPVMIAQHMATGQIEDAISALFTEDDALAVIGGLLNSDDLERIMGLYEMETNTEAIAAVASQSANGTRTKATARR